MVHMYKDLTICIPAYNEERSIVPILQELKTAFVESEIIVVDDGSVDKTRKVAASVSGVTVLFHERNMGYGAALENCNAKRFPKNGSLVRCRRPAPRRRCKKDCSAGFIRRKGCGSLA